MIKSYTEFIKESKGSYDHNNIIDYTLLEESATEKDIIGLCNKATDLKVKSVCVLPSMVKVASETLKDSSVLVCTVVSFPSGSDTPDEKLDETNRVIENGADEVDMVLNYKLLSGQGLTNYDTLWNEVSKLSNLCHSKIDKQGKKVILKVIVESGLLTEQETEIATKICIDGGADFIKTSTGKVEKGAELNKVKIMYNKIKSSGYTLKIKASGGIRNSNDIQQFLPYVDRFGIGFGSVDKLNSLESNSKSDY